MLSLAISLTALLLFWPRHKLRLSYAAIIFYQPFSPALLPSVALVGEGCGAATVAHHTRLESSIALAARPQLSLCF